MGYRPVILMNENDIKHFDSVREAARFLHIQPEEVRDALNTSETILGWVIVDDEEKGRFSIKEEHRFIFTPKPRHNWEEDVRVKEIFTRKPFSATGIWDRLKEKGE